MFGSVGSGKVGSGKVGSGNVGSGNVGSGNVGIGKVGSGKVGGGNVGSGNGPVVKFLGKNGVKIPRNPIFHHFAPRGSSNTCEVSK